jgi:hypothetical protein
MDVVVFVVALMGHDTGRRPGRMGNERVVRHSAAARPVSCPSGHSGHPALALRGPWPGRGRAVRRIQHRSNGSFDNPSAGPSAGLGRECRPWHPPDRPQVAWLVPTFRAGWFGRIDHRENLVVAVAIGTAVRQLPQEGGDDTERGTYDTEDVGQAAPIAVHSGQDARRPPLGNHRDCGQLYPG